MTNFSPKQEIAKIITSLAGRYSAYEIFSDFIHMTALAISNTVTMIHGEIWQEREKEYMTIRDKYSDEEFEKLGEVLILICDALEEEITDILGQVYMEAGMGSRSAGQFFTPFSLSVLCAKTILNLDRIRKTEDEIEISEPSCGAGGMIIATAKVLHEAGINYQRRLRVVAQDVDWKGVYMTYVQCSLLGIRATVVQGDTLREPFAAGYDRGRIFRTPAEMGALL